MASANGTIVQTDGNCLIVEKTATKKEIGRGGITIIEGEIMNEVGGQAITRSTAMLIARQIEAAPGIKSTSNH